MCLCNISISTDLPGRPSVPMLTAEMAVHFLLLSLSFILPVLAQTQIMAAELAAQYGLATSTSFPFPTATLSPSDTQNLLISQWSLGRGRIQDGADNLAFVENPFPSSSPTGDPRNTDIVNSSLPVLQVTYPENSFSHDTGGAQFFNLWNTTDGSTFGTMVLSYEVAFDSEFDWVKGGKLPGLRGGLNGTGCSGGNAATGADCFSSRLMWRKFAAGEVYAYIPTPNGLCDVNDVNCNSDFGISFDRGSFGFLSGDWLRITMLVQLNNPVDVANGQIQLYYNDRLAVSQNDLQIRSSDSVAINGLYFSTFFGGSDSSWATPRTQHTYYRNFRLWGSSATSNLTGEAVRSSATPVVHSPNLMRFTLLTFLGLYVLSLF